MFNLGAPEIMVILMVALIVLGPKRLPQAGRQLGRALADFRRVTGDMKRELTDALDVDELNDIRDTFDLHRMLADDGPADKPHSKGGPTNLAGGAAHSSAAHGYSPQVPAPDGFADHGAPQHVGPPTYGGAAVPAPD